MANLETLELTIKANAESASGGLQRLITSLVSLHGEVGKSVSALTALNRELTKLKGFSSMKLPKLTFGGFGGGASAATMAVKVAKEEASKFKAAGETLKEFKDYDDPKKGLKFQSWQYGPRPMVPVSHFRDGMSIAEQERRNQEDTVRFNRDLERANAIRAEQAEIARMREEAMNTSTSVSPARRTSSSVENGIANARGLAELRNEVQNTDHVVQTSTQNVGNAMNETASQTQAATQQMSQSVRTSTQGVSRSMNNTTSRFENFRNGIKGAMKSLSSMIPKVTLFNRLLRVASTMLMRMALRALFKGAKEGFDNYYQYAKATNGAFAKEMDSVYSAWGQLKNQLGASLASAFSAALPVIQAICSAAIDAFNALSQLIALLQGKSTWSKATNQAQSYADAINKANGGGGGGGGMKELLANFDELNVIASESGGGGGGGGAAQTAQDFVDMFEEMNTFDNGIKNVVSWLEEHLPLVNGMIAALVGSMLHLPIGINLMITGITISYSAGYEIGKNGMTGTRLAEATAGVLTTGLGAGVTVAMMGGGAVGFTVAFPLGVAISLFVLGWGIAEGEKERLYGDIHLTAEEIKAEVNKLFKFDDIEVEITRLRTAHFQLAEAKKEALDTLNELRKNYATISSEPVGASASAVEKLVASVKTLVDQTNELIAERKLAIKVGLEVTTQFDNPEEIVKFSDEQWTNLEGYVTGLGNRIGQVLQDGITIDEVELLNELEGKLERVTEAIVTGKLSGRFVADVQSGYSGTIWGEADKDTVQAYARQYVAARQGFRDALRDQAYDTKESLGGLYHGMLQRSIDEPGSVSPEDLEKARLAYENFDVDQDVLDKEREYASEGQEIFRRNMEEAFAGNFKRLMENDQWTMDTFGSALTQKENAVRDYFYGNLATHLGYKNGQELINIFDLMGTTGWDLLADDMKGKFIYYMQKTFGNRKAELYIQLKEDLNVPIEDILETNRNQWNNWTLKEKLYFTEGIVKAYGSPEAIAAAKVAGINVLDSVEQGMMSRDTKIREGSQKLAFGIVAQFTGEGVLNGAKKAGGDMIAAFVSGMEMPDAQLTKMLSSVGSGMQNAIQKSLDSKQLKVAVDTALKIQLDIIADIIPSVTNGFMRSSSMIATSLRSVVAQFATGGFPESGSLFIAGEQGAELVGNINGRTGVANEGQIVEGIRSGVADANAEQNALLRQQNELLRGILEKDSSVRLNASASLGRVAQQSLNLYNSMVGG